MEIYTENDTPDTLNKKQLQGIIKTKNDLFLDYLRDTKFDIERVRIMLELGQIEAKRKLDNI